MITLPLGERFSALSLINRLVQTASVPEKPIYLAMAESLSEFQGREIDCALVLRVNARVSALRRIGTQIIGGSQVYGR